MLTLWSHNKNKSIIVGISQSYISHKFVKFLCNNRKITPFIYLQVYRKVLE